jgi:hypothetical protein
MGVEIEADLSFAPTPVGRTPLAWRIHQYKLLISIRLLQVLVRGATRVGETEKSVEPSGLEIRRAGTE